MCVVCIVPSNFAVQNIVHKLFHVNRYKPLQKDSVEAYNLWAESYDSQPGNLMLDFDEEVFSSLLNPLDLENKKVVDIGCGTGRHWKKILAKSPASLEGFDVSAAMLQQLKKKFPQARVSAIQDNHFSQVSDASFDAIVCTLTVAHIRHLDSALRAMARILKPGGDLIITDFHPAALALGGKRTFTSKGRLINITNYIHPTALVKNLCLGSGMTVVAEEERAVDEAVKHYYEQRHAMHVYRRFLGVPMIYGMHVKKTHGPA